MGENKNSRKIVDFVRDTNIDDAAGGMGEFKVELTDADRVTMQAVQEMLGSRGWEILSAIMLGLYDTADKMLKDQRISTEGLRYNQGYINALEDVQRQFMMLSKEEGYGVVRNENTQES